MEPSPPHTAQSFLPDAIHQALRKHCLAKPHAVEEYPWGDVVWKVRGKMFAASGTGQPAVTVKASLEDQAVLVSHPAISVAPYVGRFGWVNVLVTDDETLQLAYRLIDESYHSLDPRERKRAAPKKPR